MNQQQPQKFNPTKTTKSKVIKLSIFYLLVMITYSSFSTVIVYLHQKFKHKGYGEAYLTANSLTSIFTYAFCPYILDKIKFKSSKMLFLCALGYMFNMLLPAAFIIFQEGAQNQKPSRLRFVVEMTANVIGGFASGIFLVLNAVYMTEICKQIEDNKKGRFFSISNIILSSRVVIGPIITIFGLGWGSEKIYFVILTGIAIAALPFPYFVVPQINSQTQSNLFKKQQQISKSLCSHIVEYAKCINQVRFLLISSLVCGFIMGFVASSLSHLLPPAQTNKNNDEYLSIALVFFGIGNMIGGYLSGYHSDKYSIKTAGYIGNILIIISCLASAWCLSTSRTLQKTYLVGLASGLAFSYLSSVTVLACTINYKGSPQSFAVNRQVLNLAYISYQWAVAFINNMCNMKFNMIYQSLGLIPLAFMGILCMHYQGKRKIQNKLKSTQDFNMVSMVENTVSSQQIDD